MDGISGYISDSSETKSGENSPGFHALNEDMLKRIRDKRLKVTSQQKQTSSSGAGDSLLTAVELVEVDTNNSVQTKIPVAVIDSTGSTLDQREIMTATRKDEVTSEELVKERKSRSRSSSAATSRSRSRSPKHSKSSRRRRSRSSSPKRRRSRTPKKKKRSRSRTPKRKRRSRSRSPRRSRSRTPRRRKRSRSRTPKRRRRSRSRTPKNRRNYASGSRRKRSRSRSRDKKRRYSRSHSRERRRSPGGSKRKRRDRSKSLSRSLSRSPSHSPSQTPDRTRSADPGSPPRESVGSKRRDSNPVVEAPPKQSMAHQESSVTSSSPLRPDVVSSSRKKSVSSFHEDEDALKRGSRSPSPGRRAASRSWSLSPRRIKKSRKANSKTARSPSSSGSDRRASLSPKRGSRSKGRKRDSRSRSLTPKKDRKSKSSRARESRSRSASPGKKQLKSARRSLSRSLSPKKSRRSRSRSPKRHRRRSRSRSPKRSKSSKSRRRSRSKSPPRRKSRSRSRKRSRSRSHKRSRSRSRKRSRSPRRRRKSRSRTPPRRRRQKSRSRSPRRRRSRSWSPRRRRSHSRSRSRSRSRSISTSPLTRGRDAAMHAQEALARRLERAKKLMEMKERRDKDEKEREKVLKLETDDTLEKEIAKGVESNTTSLNPPPLMSLTPMGIDPLIQAAAAAAAMQAKVLAQTGISMPKYYNPLTVNPVQIAEQTRKRKLLWSAKKEDKIAEKVSSNQWERTSFDDNETKAKFRRLMGIKEGEEIPEQGADQGDTARQQEERVKLFQQLDQEYQIARVKTHTQRSFGLGFGHGGGPVIQQAPTPPTTSS
ncbi:uncharacterized protein [Asterias amurensis]|uniref:uncharacterized protein isoform X1 n=1 Tax=Asterias amurensis TaxID=7602 RepID=UPI003AB22977